ncbi:MAG: transcription termination/antitermination protein NusA [Ruminococcus sp.]|nr:transcription termination/antitermination protein NusA [Ruminococcus sp.]
MSTTGKKGKKNSEEQGLDFFQQLRELGTENGIDAQVLIEKVKSAMLKAAKRAYPHSEDRIRVDIDPVTRRFEMYIRQDIIEDMPIDENEVNIDEAKTRDPNAMVGGTIYKRLDISKLGRMAALSAKQSIKGDLRDINREQILNKFDRYEHDIIPVTVYQVEPGRGTVTVDFEGSELYLFKNEQIPGETLREGDKIKVYITNIAARNKKPIVKISRTHKDFVKRLFEKEVPEIHDGIIEVKSVSREAGSRTKIAVWSGDENIDPVGSCIGTKSCRIAAVSRELNGDRQGGEKIDVIQWSEKPEEFIANALAPAVVMKTIIISEEEKTCTVIVSSKLLSLAIGQKGQNAKLAAKLTGYKIDIKPDVDENGNTAPELDPNYVPPVTVKAETAETADENNEAEPEAAENAFSLDGDSAAAEMPAETEKTAEETTPADAENAAEEAADSADGE